MTKRVNKLEILCEIIREGKPAEVLYDLGKGKERTEALVTYNDGNIETYNRITSSPLIKLSEDNGGISMDITDSDKNADVYSYKGLRPHGAVFEKPVHTPYELGNLVIDLEDSRKLAISPYARAE